MRKSALLIALLIGACLLAPNASAGGTKAIKSTFYFHGTETVGEIDLANNFGAAYNRMDTTKPSDAAPKSLAFTTWNGTPWNDCAGSYLLPVWTGSVTGRIVGDMKVTLHTASAPLDVKVQVWPDLMTQTCASNDVSEGEYPYPAAEKAVTLPPGPGETTITLKKVNFKAGAALTLMILPDGPTPGRVLYDAPDFASSITFSCMPAPGERKCLP